MKINNEDLLQMFRLVPLDKAQLHDALRQLGRSGLKKHLQPKWSRDNPTYGYCYNVSEFLARYALGTYDSYCMPIRNSDIIHWAVKTPYGEWVDLTADQFDNYDDIDYDSAIRKAFFPVKDGGPSKRTRLLAKLMGYDEDQWK